jgi:hypothetical protein
MSSSLIGNSLKAADPAGISGSYLEVRTSDVYTGPCFANGEVNLTGKEAVMAWSVSQGEWDGVSLEGLKVVAVVQAKATLGDPFAEPLPARAVVVVDQKADSIQSQALLDFAKTMAGPLLGNVVAVESSSIEMQLVRNQGFASLKAGDIAELSTRPLNHHDAHCGNESVYYPPLTATTSATPAYTLENRFTGEGLDSTWSYPSKRSAFVGTFQH